MSRGITAALWAIPFRSRLVRAQVRGLQLVCKLRFWGAYGGGGLPAAGAKILAIFSVNHCILALKVMPHTL